MELHRLAAHRGAQLMSPIKALYHHTVGRNQSEVTNKNRVLLNTNSSHTLPAQWTSIWNIHNEAISDVRNVSPYNKVIYEGAHNKRGVYKERGAPPYCLPV